MYIEEQVVKLTEYFIGFCRKNPDLCPHDWQLTSISTVSETEKHKVYQCSLCGQSRTEVLIREPNESDWNWKDRTGWF
jgi:transcription elongation factor Elf1